MRRPQRNARRSTFGIWLALAGIIIAVGAFYVLIQMPRLDACGGPRIERDIALIKIALLEYKTQFGAFPSGDSRAIVRALTGDNPKRMPFIGMPPDGELLDPWGTPYRIYSGDAPLIRSAGPDKLFDTGSGREKTDDYFRD